MEEIVAMLIKQHTLLGFAVHHCCLSGLRSDDTPKSLSPSLEEW
jgi:hypothetical protein